MYRVGYQCFATSEAAHDYLLSQQLPTITAEGKILRPIKQGQDWYLQGQKVQLSFPRCDIAEQVSQGGLLVAPFIILAMLVFFIRKVQSLIESVGIRDD